MPGRLKRALFLLLIAGCCSRPSSAQQRTDPVLHDRQTETPDTESAPAARHAPIDDTLPADISGPYHFDHLNESIELDVDRGKVTGYISRLGDAETDSNTPLTFFFDKGSVTGSRIEFQTRVLHGVWYSFRGTVVRGNAETRDDDGYYVLQGTLQEHHPQGGEEKSADETVESRTVSFKSMGR